MKLTKALEAEILQFMENYWNTYFSGDLKKFSSLIRDDYHNIGTTEVEDWRSKDDMMRYSETVIDQIVGTVQIRNRKTHIMSIDPYFMVHEYIDLYINTGVEWVFYSKMRLSSLIEKSNHGLQVVHQHGSVPDTKAQDGETIGFQKISQENLELREAIKRRTIELEHKNRELEIESAVERVRAQSMAMHHPDDLDKVNKEILNQLNGLQVPGLTGVTFYLIDKDGWVKAWDFYSPGNIGDQNSYTLQYDFKKYEMMGEPFEVLRQTDFDYYVADYPLEKLERAVCELEVINPSVANVFKEALAKGILTHQWTACARISDGLLGVDLVSPPSEDTKTIVLKIAGAFNQAYQRFLDLQKAQEQAREAQIEAALERTRTQSMLMQHSDELLEISKVFHEQLLLLGIDSEFSFVWLPNEEKGDHLFWATWMEEKDGNKHFHARAITYPLDMTEPYTVACFVDWRSGLPVHEHFIKPEDVESFFASWEELLESADKLKPEFFPDGIYYTEAYMKYGCFGIDIRRPLSQHEKDVLYRFAIEFERAYTRFLDLQKAEAQAREAKIEAALEKVRSRSLAMHATSELGEVVTVIVEKLTDLGVILDANGVVLCTYFNDSKNVLHWIVSPDFSMAGSYLLPYFDHPIFNAAWASKEKGDEYFSQAFSIDEKNSFFEYAFEHSDYKHFPDEFKQWIFQNDKHILSFAWQNNSAILIPSHTGVVPSEEDVAILKRFSKVFEQSYIRFLDLQKAEAQARESQIELSLEKIRSQVASMQESTDLLDIMVNIRSEFVALGQEAHYFWYMRWFNDKYEKAMTSGDGTQVGMIMTLPRHIHGDIPLVANWEQGDEPTLIFAMDVETAVEYVDKMITLGDFEQVDPHAPTLDDIRHIGGLTFVMARTSQGEIGYSLPGEVHHPPEEAVNTLARFAGVFDLAYRRFEDLKAAEHQALLIREERDRLEVALNELHATQTQLIQQEKLASLGQLTAGIAHEIKNPLNFVNNFSEVSIEMIEEALEELAKAKTQHAASQLEAIQETENILSDIKSNLSKIHEHGSRADGIVKSMLQHSRGGSGKKEPTDLNALIKEYVNLSFHGMRAGKNPINVDIQLDLDEKPGKVNLISEDFSRVVLNLVNNAFDAMRQKSEKINDTSEKYFPELTIRTKSENDHILIEVEDNGPGIPDDIKDKILQPFFTTKKGTEGTGLGLSITNDIVKAHGGELEIETAINKGTIFKIKLNT